VKKSKTVIIVPVLQLKLFVPLGNLEAVVVQFAKIAKQEHFKARRVKQLVKIALLDGVTKEMDLLVAMLFLRDHTLWRELK